MTVSYCWRRCTVKRFAAPQRRLSKTGERRRQCDRQPGRQKPRRYEQAGVSIQSRGRQRSHVSGVHGSNGWLVLIFRRYGLVSGKSIVSSRLAMLGHMTLLGASDEPDEPRSSGHMMTSHIFIEAPVTGGLVTFSSKFRSRED